ncbi:hypothetical protein MZ16F87_41750 [Escherichia coli]|uniref:Uncharacterized protein n=1 Tax=Escherichia phage fEgEco12 TaxID=3158837 RepID=A0AAU7PH35_9CAUD|nr:hypothetical protein Ecwhy1_137 [Escherichia phage Ecwhy_1]WGM49617.1 virion structural protein [Escherichia phage vB_Ec-M-J]HBB3761068.1 hypothetical protein [Escherichia coli]
MKPYTFYTINTVVDIGDGTTPTIIDSKFTGAMNLSRLLEAIMAHDYPMMVSVVKTEVDLYKDNNASFYNLPVSWGKCTLSTFKFAIPMDVDLRLNGIPLVLPTELNGKRITKFITTGNDTNISISKQTFS